MDISAIAKLMSELRKLTNVEPVMATTMEQSPCFEHMEGGSQGMIDGSPHYSDINGSVALYVSRSSCQDEPCDLDWECTEECYEDLNEECYEDLNQLHSAQDHFAKLDRESMMVRHIAAHDKNRARQALHVLVMYGFGGAGVRPDFARDLFWDFYLPGMFQKIDIKKLVRRILCQVRPHSWNTSLASDRSIRRKIKDAIDFILGIDEQNTIRENGIGMNILRRTFEALALALAEECNQFSVGLDIPPATFRSLKHMHTHIRPVQKPPSMKDLGTEGVNFSITDSSLQNGDASVRVRWHRTPEVDTSFCSSPWILDSAASVCSTGGLNHPVFVANGQSIFSNYFSTLRTLSSLLGDCSKTEMKNTRHRVRKSRHNKGHRMVARRCLGQKTRYHKRGDTTRAASQKNRGVVSRSEPVAADNSSLLTPDSTPKRSWRLASATPQHMTGYLKYLTDYTPASGDQFIDTLTMGRMPFHGRGSVNTTTMTLRDVLYVPGLETNLVSTGQLAELGYTIAIGPYGCRIYKDDEGMDLVGKAHYVDGYLLELDFLRV